MSETEVETLCALGDHQLAPLFWDAELVHQDSAWCSHIPFANWIVGAAAPRVFVELGSHTGVSYLSFCNAVERWQLATKCFAVDTWRGDQHAGYYGDDVYAALSEQNQRRFPSFSNLIRSTFDDALAFFADGSIDLLHIDGLHTYHAVRQDFENWLPKLSDRAVVLFHDTNVRRDDFGVWRLWAELSGRYPSFEFLHGFGLGVLGVGGNVPPAVAALWHGTDPVVLRSRFAFLGARWEAERLTKEHAEGAQYAVVIEEHAAQRLAEAQRSAQATIDSLTQDLQAQCVASKATQESTADRLADLQAQSVALATLQERLAAAERDAARCRVELEGLQLAVTRERINLRKTVRDAELETAVMRESTARQTRARFLTEARLRSAQRHVAALQEGFGWPILQAINGFDTRLPVIRRGLRAGWWLVTGQLRQRRQDHAARGQARLAEAQAQVAKAAKIRESGLFDTAYYLDLYPDAANSGMLPELHYAVVGSLEGRRPGPDFDPDFYVTTYLDVAQSDTEPLLHYIDHGRLEGRRPLPMVLDRLPELTDDRPSRESELGEPTVRMLLERQFAALRPLPVYQNPNEARSIIILTDSIGPQSLFGGVGTAMVVGTLMARRLGCKLRVATRMDAPDGHAYGEVRAANKLGVDVSSEFIYVPLDGSKPLSVGPCDVIVTTSWWTTRSAMRSLGTQQIIYLIQEDERMFYAFGDERLRCTEVLNDERLRLLINTEALFGHLDCGPNALPGIKERGAWFTPAFPSIPVPQWDEDRPKRNFFFYARPHNQRNLFWRGLEAIEAALEKGVLDGTRWNFYFVGKDIPKMVLPGGYEPIVVSGMSWANYAAFVSTMDLGLSLMDTPHPSYPPIDLAAGGAVVVTSMHGAKVNLDHWSRNIICAPPTVEGLVDGLRRGVALASDMKWRKANHAANAIGTDWHAALQPALERLLPLTPSTGLALRDA